MLDFDDGFVVTKVFTDPTTGQQFGDIVEYSGNPLGAVERFFADGIPMVSTWALPHTPSYALLKQAGFSELPRERYFCIKALEPTLEYLYDITHWHLMPADAEIY